MHNGADINGSASGDAFVIDDSGKTVLPDFVFDCRCDTCALGRAIFLHSDQVAHST